MTVAPPPEQVLAFRFARSGLAARTADLAAAAACPLSDFARDAALTGLAARADGVTRERALRELVVAHTLRRAIHLQAPDALGVFGRPLLDDEDPDVDTAVADTLAGGPLGKDDLHAALRERLPEDRLPWCRSCGSHHVAPMVWRASVVRVGTRLDARRRYELTEVEDAEPAEAVRRFLGWYGPATRKDFADWAGVKPGWATPFWPEDGLLEDDRALLESPPEPSGVRLLPPGDPFLQRPNRPLLAPDPELRKRLFRPVASPGVVLVDGRVAGTWKRAKGKVTTQALGRAKLPDLTEEIERLP